MAAPLHAFTALSQPREFRSLSLARAPREGAPAHQPLPIQRGSAGPPGLRLAAGTAAMDELEQPAAPPPPTHEELATAERARVEAEHGLAAAQAEVSRLKAALEAERARTQELATAFDDALSETRQELRVSYARLVLQGARRLVGSLEQHEAVFLTRLQEVADQLVLENEVIIRVAPRNKEAAEAAVFGRAGWLVEIDPSMDGGCLALCRNATVDARMETAFAGLERALEVWVQDDGQASTGH